MAGPNGSGKSSFTARLRIDRSLQNWIDPDVVFSKIRGLAGPEVDDEGVARSAFRESRNQRVAYAQDLVDFGFETVFSHGENVAFLKALRIIGYEVHLYFVCTDYVLINLERVLARVKRGGHGVPPDKIVGRYRKSLMVLTLAIGACDRIILLDNSDAVTTEPAAGRLVGEIAFNSDDPES